ncbi:MAG: M28 family peptidase [Verrucomicrobiales bacterium]|nr:M28 family peptidase [Verrucomicrobiales bacterium]
MVKEGKWLRIAVVALPVGLFILGVASMIYTNFRPERPEYDEDYRKRMDAASLNRKPVNRADLERYTKILATEIGERNLAHPKKLESAAIWIQSTLKGGNLGYRVKSQVFAVDEKTEVRNLHADLTGGSRRREIIVVGAHYDSAPGCPGANSGGSGVAAVLSLAQAFAGDPQERTIRFSFFVNSQGEMPGSRVAAKRSEEDGENIVAMLSLDSIGYFSEAEGSQKWPEGLAPDLPDQGNFIAFSGDELARFRMDSAKTLFSASSGIPAVAIRIPGLESDHTSFARYQFPAVLVTDTARYRDPSYGKPTDTYDKLDFDALKNVSVGLKSVVEAWANP